MRLLLFIVLWSILLVLCWPVAVVVLLLLPVVYLLVLPFRLAFLVIEAVFSLLRAVLMLPTRLLAATG